MNIYIDAFSGVSGDKINGALLGLFDDDERNNLIEDFKKLLKLDDEYDILLEKKIVSNILTNKFTVNTNEHKHSTHLNRNLKDIINIIDNSDFNSSVKQNAKSIFNLIAEAEANVHNKTINEVHFHEVGAIDSIVDIIMVSYLIDILKVSQIYSSKIAVGNGFTKTQHGVIPIPAPATIRLSKNIPLRKTTIEAELTTPTGAAIVKHFVTKFCDEIELNIQKIGLGSGSREIEIPNYTRIFLINSEQNKNSNVIYQLETNIDDCGAEQLAFVTENLFNIGALDVYTIPTIMKKGRLGHLIVVLCEKNNIKKIEKYIFDNTTTLGIRQSKKERTTLDRKSEQIDIDGIPVGVKIAYFDNKVKQIIPEYESVKSFALKKRINYPDALSHIQKKIDKLYF